MIFFQIHDSRRLLITYSFNDVLSGYLRYDKIGNKKRAICFATWLQNEFNGDVARFTTHENKPCNLISCKTDDSAFGSSRFLRSQVVGVPAQHMHGTGHDFPSAALALFSVSCAGQEESQGKLA